MNKLYRNNRKMYYKAFAGCMYKKARILNILRKDILVQVQKKKKN